MYKVYFFFRRIIDFLLSFLMIIVLSPLFIVLAFAVKIDSKGPVFFKQKRIGKKGRVFKMIKFRSMVVDAQNSGTGVYSFGDDPRITKVGKFIRKTSLDELPQLFNVFIGQMAFVGPRAPVYGHFPEYEKLPMFVKKRFSVLPGITGYAQCTGRNEMNWEEKINADNIYVDKVKKYGLLFDVKIWFMTLKKVLSRSDVQETEDNQKANEEFFRRIMEEKE